MHSDFVVQEGQSTVFFVLDFVSEAISLLVCPVSHTFVHQLIAKKKKLTELFRL